MLDIKRLAQILRKSKRVIIENREDEYFITDTYIFIRLAPSEFEDFRESYNDYKTTSDIPKYFEEVISSTANDKFDKYRLNFAILLKQFKEAKKKVEVTKFIKRLKTGKEAIIYKVDGDCFSIIDRKYEFLLELGDEYKAEEEKRPVFVIDEDNKLKAAIMPMVIAANNTIKEELEDLLKSNGDEIEQEDRVKKSV